MENKQMITAPTRQTMLDLLEPKTPIPLLTSLFFGRESDMKKR
jgi:hypothetical protein